MSGNGLKVALAASLALNVFVIGAGVGVGAMMLRDDPPGRDGRGGDGPRGDGRAGGNPMMQSMDRLTPEVRDEFRNRMRTQGETSRVQLDAARDKRREAAELLARGDQAGAVEALRAARQGELETRERLEAMIVEYATTLDPEQRAIVAEALRRPGGPGGRGPGGRGRMGPDGPGASPPATPSRP